MTNRILSLKLKRLGEQNYKRDKFLPVIDKGSPEWEMWRSWYDRYGLYETGFMETRERWTAPCELPPTDIDVALAEGGPAAKRLAG